jgi:hypothetical protein
MSYSALEFALRMADLTLGRGDPEGAVAWCENIITDPAANSHIRNTAVLLRARCYCRMGKYDIALTQLKEAAREATFMDGIGAVAVFVAIDMSWPLDLKKVTAGMMLMDEKQKENVYERGLVFEATGRTADALEAFREIYKVDCFYRDVSPRVERAYGHGP